MNSAVFWIVYAALSIGQFCILRAAHKRGTRYLNDKHELADAVLDGSEDLPKDIPSEDFLEGWYSARSATLERVRSVLKEQAEHNSGYL